MAVTITYRLKHAYKTAAEWTAADPVLLAGEYGIESDTKKRKLGDGVTAWTALDYDGALGAALTALNGLTPAADRVPYFTGASSAALATFTAFGRSLIDDADAAAGRATLGAAGLAGGNSFTGNQGVTNNQAGNTALDVTNTSASGFGLYLQGGGVSNYIANFCDYTGASVLQITSTFFRPGTDNTVNLGSGSNRLALVVSAGGVVTTSDETHKAEIGPIPDAVLDAWADVEWLRFKVDGGIRWHTGVVAQRIIRVFKRHSLDATEYGLLCRESWGATRARKAQLDKEGRVVRPAVAKRSAGSIWMVRYDEASAMEHALNRRERARMRAEIDELRRLLAG
jgi:hypothetical protein